MGDTLEDYEKTAIPFIGVVTLSSFVAWALGFTDAGHGYSWQPMDLLNTTMKKESWGWLVYTVIPDLPVGLFPLVQVVDGTGARTKYYDEYIAFMSTRHSGDKSFL